MTRLPSNAHQRRSEPHEWDRRDEWEEPLPFDWRELLDPWLWLGALMVLASIVAFFVLAVAFTAPLR